MKERLLEAFLSGPSLWVEFGAVQRLLHGSAGASSVAKQNTRHSLEDSFFLEKKKFKI